VTFFLGSGRYVHLYCVIEYGQLIGFGAQCLLTFQTRHDHIISSSFTAHVHGYHNSMGISIVQIQNNYQYFVILSCVADWQLICLEQKLYRINFAGRVAVCLRRW
jgi:hypothetical protein